VSRPLRASRGRRHPHSYGGARSRRRARSNRSPRQASSRASARPQSVAEETAARPWPAV
jgi:hypothetical protein